MKEFVATVTSKGQVTLPAQLRRHLRIGTHARLLFVLGDDGAVRIQLAPYPSVRSLMGAAGSLGTPLSWDTMRDIAREDRIAAKLCDGSA